MSSDGRGIPTLSILGGVSMGSRLPSHGYNKNGGYVKFWGARGDGSVRTGAYRKLCILSKHRIVP